MLHAIVVEGWMAQLMGLLLIGALLSARSHSLANRLLAVGLFSAVYRVFLLTTQFSGAVASPILFRTSFPVQMLAIPLFYLYVNALTIPKFSLERKHAVHLIPFAIGLAWYFAVWIWGSTQLLELGPTYLRERYARVVVKVLVAIPYLIRSHRQVQGFAKKSKDHLSDLTPLKLQWLHTLLIILYSMTAVDALDAATGPELPVWYLTPSIALISLITLAWFSLRVSPVFDREVKSQESDSIAEFEPVQHFEPVQQKSDSSPSRLPEEELERQKKRLIDLLETQSLYLDPELRLSDLATALHIRPYRVSEILSRGLQTSFYDLINRYRVTKARELLFAPGSAHLNLLGIAMESGFKSKSVFNDVFKKITGQTPSQFRTARMTESIHSDS